MTPYEFIAKWRASELKERSAAQEHFIDLCRLLDEPTPAEADPTGGHYCFERGARKDTGGDGWADVWKRHHFAWEYKGQRANLDAAFIAAPAVRASAGEPAAADCLRHAAVPHPHQLDQQRQPRPRVRTGRSRRRGRARQAQMGTFGSGAPAARRNAAGAHRSAPQRPSRRSRRDCGSAATTRGSVAHFVNRLVFCMFAEDVGLLPSGMFTRMLEQARRQPEAFAGHARILFGAMATGGWVGFEEVAWFDGGLFDDDSALPLWMKDEIETVLATADLDWSEIDLSILGTLFERGLDPRKRAQLGRALHRPRQDHAHRRAGNRASLAGGMGNGERRRSQPAWNGRTRPGRERRGTRHQGQAAKRLLRRHS